MVYTPDTLIMPALVALHECFCAELTKSGLNDGCECIMLPGIGDVAAEPEPGKGFGWVGITSISPYSIFPQPDASLANTARPIMASATIGVIRCLEVSRNGPSPESLLGYLDKQMADMAAMRRAVICCTDDSRDMVLGPYEPIGPEGGIFGGLWTVSIGQAL